MPNGLALDLTGGFIARLWSERLVGRCLCLDFMADICKNLRIITDDNYHEVFWNKIVKPSDVEKMKHDIFDWFILMPRGHDKCLLVSLHIISSEVGHVYGVIPRGAQMSSASGISTASGNYLVT